MLTKIKRLFRVDSRLTLQNSFFFSLLLFSCFIDFVSFRYILFSYFTDFVVSFRWISFSYFTYFVSFVGFRFLTLQISSFLFVGFRFLTLQISLNFVFVSFRFVSQFTGTRIYRIRSLTHCVTNISHLLPLNEGFRCNCIKTNKYVIFVLCVSDSYVSL